MYIVVMAIYGYDYYGDTPIEDNYKIVSCGIFSTLDAACLKLRDTVDKVLNSYEDFSDKNGIPVECSLVFTSDEEANITVVMDSSTAEVKLQVLDINGGIK
jgi:hypothetical protein